MPSELSLFSFDRLIPAILICGSGLILLVRRTGGPQAGGTTAKKSHGGIVLISCVSAVLLALLVQIRNPVGMRPDAWTEAVVVTGGRNYVRTGFGVNAGVPQFQPITEGNPSDPFFLYSTFPSGMYWINGLWQVCGITAVSIHRLLPIFCSVAALLVWFRFVRSFCGESVASLAALVMATSFGFLGYADSLAYHAYTLLTVLLFMVFFENAIHAQRSARAGWLTSCMAAAALTALMSHEYHFFMLIYLVGRLVAWGGVRKLGYVLVLIAPLLSVAALQQWQRHTIMAEMPTGATSGGATPWSDIYRRTIGFSAAIDTPHGLTLAGYPLWLAQRYFNFFGLPVIAGVVLVGIILLRRREDVSHSAGMSGAKLCALLLLAGAGWWVVMMQHTSVHAHTMRLGLPGYSLLVALAIHHSWKTLREGGKVPVRAACVILILSLAYVQTEGVYAFARNMTAEKFWDPRERSDFGAGESQQFSKLAAIVPPDAVILTNHSRLAPMRLWTDRPVYNGSTAFFPPGDSQHGRRFLEMSLLHLRQLHAGSMPHLYYVFWIYPSATFQDALWESELLRILMTGGPNFGDDGGVRSFLSLQSAIKSGESRETFCPIRGVIPEAGLLVFDFDPAVPAALREWGRNPAPTLQEFGPAR